MVHVLVHVATKRASMNCHCSKVLGFNHAHIQAENRACGVAKEVDAFAIDRILRFHGFYDFMQKIGAIHRKRPFLGIEGVGRCQNDSLFFRQSLPRINERHPIVARPMQQQDQRFWPTSIGRYKEIVGARLPLRRDAQLL